MNIVDTHAHVYHADESLYPMVEEPSRPPKETGSIEHLKSEMNEAGVRRAVLVQTGSAYKWDNRLLADLCVESRGWAVGVCSLDPSAAHTIEELERLSRECNIKGLRVAPIGETYPMFYHPGTTRIWEAAQRLGIVICAHIRSSLLDQLSDLLARFPDVQVVLDHSGYPMAKDGEGSETVQAVCGLSRFRNLSLKLSFTVFGSDMDYPFTDTHAIARSLIEAFTPERCMWGSGFPCEHWLKKATYAEHLAVFTQELGLSESEKRGILEETPNRIWFGTGL